ncbi:ABC transporter substrate-binding protein [Desulfovibrio sp. OttesenSCG-928-C06]|nr:ABC transporter substrate-binding protein [Desulfovibrio sp. OttesenSCG-928-C06]
MLTNLPNLAAPSDKTNKSIGRNIPLLLVAALLGLTLGLGACIKQPIRTGTSTPVTQPQQKPQTLNAARSAFESGDMAQAQRLASLYLSTAAPADPERAEAWSIIARTCVSQDRPEAALKALASWREIAPQDTAGTLWMKTWSNALGLMPYSKAATAATGVYSDSSYPAPLRIEAGLFMTENRLRAGNVEGLSANLEQIYSLAPDVSARKDLEQRLFRQMHRAGQGAVTALAGEVTEINEKYYPYALYRLEEARRLYLDPDNQELAKEVVSFLREESELAEQSLFRTWADPDLSIFQGHMAGTLSIGLVLPMSGEYGNLADKIVHGAEIAARAYANSGFIVKLQVIDSDQPDWMQRLNALPEDVQIIGGPLRLSDYQDIRQSGLTSKRKFFAFLRSLDGNDEGRAAWRFFSSDADQLSAVLRFARNIGIEKFGTMIPDEPYGQRMFEGFQQEATRQGAQLLDNGVYPAGQHQDWNKLVAEFLHTKKEAEKAPATKYHALFLPDSWRNATIMMPHFFYYRENRLLFMGTMLWEQGISMQKYKEIRNHRMIVFPGAWDPNNTSPSGMLLRTSMAASGDAMPDFWISLGYDFVSMSASLNLPKHASTSDLNKALSALGQVPWSGAPFAWDNNGQARQDLFVFTPDEDGFILADPARFRTYYKRAWGIR